MKRLFRFMVFLLPLLMFETCSKDNITYLDTDIYDIEDDIANTTFDRTVSIVFSTSGNAMVSEATSSGFIVTVNGNDVTIVNNSEEVVMYELSGTTTDGFFKLYSSRKQGVTMNDVNITNKNGSAVNIQGTTTLPNKGKRTFVVVNGSNSLSDGASYSDTPSGEDEKAAFFSEGQLVFSGTGSLSVNATGKSGIVSDDYIRITSALTLSVASTAGHGLKANDFVAIMDGSIDINVSADMKKGISSDGYVVISGGTININVTGGTARNDNNEYVGSAGIKADGFFKITDGTLTITNTGTGGKGISCDGTGTFAGGMVSVTTTGSNYGSSGGGGGFPGGRNANDDSSVSAKAIKFDGDLTFSGAKVVVKCTAHEGIETKSALIVASGEVYSYSAADDAINSGGDMTITGGYVCGYATSNDGLDANGDCYIRGGVVYAIGSNSPEVAVDANTENNKKLYVQGGTIVAIGGLEQGSSLTQGCYSASSWSQNTWYGLTVGSSVYAFKTPASGGTPLVVSGSSTPTLLSDVTTNGGTSRFEGMLVENTSLSGGSSVTLSSYSGGNGGGGGTPPGGGGNHPGGPF